MNMFLTRLYCIIFFAATTTAAAFISFSNCSDNIHQYKEDTIPLFVFGDSFFDAGNNNYVNTTDDFQANFWPYGETFFKYPTGRFSDGRVIPDFIAEFANLPLIPPFLENGQRKNWSYGVNFASGGAGALLETHAGKDIDMKTQLGDFETVEQELRSQLGNKEAKHLLSNSVYFFSVGANDVRDPSPIYSSYSPEDYVTIMIGNFTETIKELHNKGARKFGFFSLLPLGCLPYIRAKKGVNGQCWEVMTSLTKLYNAALFRKLQDLEKQLEGFHYSVFDSFTVAMDMIDNPSKYGFKEVKSACCGSGTLRGDFDCGRGETKKYELCKNPEDYLFFDSFHPGEKGHRILAEQMWHGGDDVAWSINLKSLFHIRSPHTR